MINLRRLLFENPDVASYHGELHRYGSKTAFGIFSIFHDQQTNRWVAAVASLGQIKTSDSDLNKLIDFEDLALDDSNTDVMDVHPNLLDVLVTLKRIPRVGSYFEYRSDRRDIPVNGRVWKTKDGKQYLVSLWSRIPSYSKYKKEIDSALRLLKAEPEKCSYEFIEHPNKWYSYADLNAQKADVERGALSDEEVRKLLKIQHLNPDVKKILARSSGPDRLQTQADELGTTVAAIKNAMNLYESAPLKESPDDIEPIKGHQVSYMDHSKVIAVVCVGYYQNDGARKFGWLAGNSQSGKIWLNGEELPGVEYEGETHGDLRRSADYDDYSFEDRCNFRLYKIVDKYYASFWSGQYVVKKYKETIIECLDFLTSKKHQEVMYQFDTMADDKFVSFADAFGIKQKRTRSKEEAELIKALHLMPAAQKAELLKKMGAMKPTELQKAADKFGMTTIELRQALGLDVAENSLGNLSFSDYNDPSIPYEAKPRPSLTPSYGTNFEHFTRKRKRFR